jgi:undecaprenyl-diphosphatase
VRSRRPGLNQLFVGLGMSGTGTVWFTAAGLLMLLYLLGLSGIPRLQELLAAMLGAFLSLVLGQLLKRLVRRPRPFTSIADHTPLGRLPRDGSMPSTHASTTVGLAVGLMMLGHPFWPLVLPWAALVVVSRLYTGVHYPSDLLVGSLIGAGFGLFNWRWLVVVLLG